MLAGVVASRVLYRGESLLSFKLQIAGFVAFLVLIVLGPLLRFTPKMAAAKRKGLAQRYVDGFERKWVLGELASCEELLGSSDIQSLADLANGYAMICVRSPSVSMTSRDWPPPLLLHCCHSFSRSSPPKNCYCVSLKSSFEVAS